MIKDRAPTKSEQIAFIQFNNVSPFCPEFICRRVQSIFVATLSELCKLAKKINLSTLIDAFCIIIDKIWQKTGKT